MRPCSLLLALFLLAMPTVSLAQPDESERRTGAGAPLPAITETALDAVSCSETVNRGAARYVTDASPPGVFFCIEGEWVRLGEGSGFSLSCSATGQVPTWDEDGDTFVCDTPEGGGDMLNSENLSGLTNTTTARSNLGLGNAATLDVGTTTGTVAAGDDARLSDTRTPTDNSVTSAKIADGAITNADVNASAGIEGSKLQAASASNAGVVTTGTQTFGGAKTFSSVTSSVQIPNGTGSFGASNPLSFLIPAGASHVPTALRNMVIDEDGSGPAWADGWAGFWTTEAMRLLAIQADRIPADGTGSWLWEMDDADGVPKARFTAATATAHAIPRAGADGKLDPGWITAGAAPTRFTRTAVRQLRELVDTGYGSVAGKTVKYFSCNPTNTPGCADRGLGVLPAGDDANAPTCGIGAPCETLAAVYAQCFNGTTICRLDPEDYQIAGASIPASIPRPVGCTDDTDPCFAIVSHVPGQKARIFPTGSAFDVAAYFHVTGTAPGGSGTADGGLAVFQDLELVGYAPSGDTTGDPFLVLDDGWRVHVQRVSCRAAAKTAPDQNCVRLSQDSKGTVIDLVVDNVELAALKLERGALANVIGVRCTLHGDGSGNYAAAATGCIDVTALGLTNSSATVIANGVPGLVLADSLVQGKALGSANQGSGVWLAISDESGFEAQAARLISLGNRYEGWRTAATNSEGCIAARAGEPSGTTYFKIHSYGDHCANSDAALSFSTQASGQTNGANNILWESVADLGSSPIIHMLGAAGWGWIKPGDRWAGFRSVLRDDGNAGTPMFEGLRIDGVGAGAAQNYADVAALRSGLATASAGAQAASAHLWADHTALGGTLQPVAPQLEGPTAACDPAAECSERMDGVYVGTLFTPIPPIPALGNAEITEIRWTRGGSR